MPQVQDKTCHLESTVQTLQAALVLRGGSQVNAQTGQIPGRPEAVDKLSLYHRRKLLWVVGHGSKRYPGKNNIALRPRLVPVEPAHEAQLPEAFVRARVRRRDVLPAAPDLVRQLSLEDGPDLIGPPTHLLTVR